MSDAQVFSLGPRYGSVTANNAGVVNVPLPSVTANSVVLLSVKTAVGANAGVAYVSSLTAGTGFSIVGGAADTSVYNYVVLN